MVRLGREVDGLGTWPPTDPPTYREMGQTMAHVGSAKPHWDEPREAA